MKEEYKFVGFISEIELFAEAERYVVDLLREILATLPDHQQWSVITIKFGRDVCHASKSLFDEGSSRRPRQWSSDVTTLRAQRASDCRSMILRQLPSTKISACRLQSVRPCSLHICIRLMRAVTNFPRTS